MKIEWLDEAREDLISLYAWYARESYRAAQRYSKVILDDVKRLSGQPRLGHPEPLLDSLEYEFRTLVSGIYKIIYFIDGDIIFIFRIWDCRQNPSRLHRPVR